MPWNSKIQLYIPNIKYRQFVVQVSILQNRYECDIDTLSILFMSSVWILYFYLIHFPTRSPFAYHIYLWTKEEIKFPEPKLSRLFWGFPMMFYPFHFFQDVPIRRLKVELGRRKTALENVEDLSYLGNFFFSEEYKKLILFVRYFLFVKWKVCWSG